MRTEFLHLDFCFHPADGVHMQVIVHAAWSSGSLSKRMMRLHFACKARQLSKLGIRSRSRGRCLTKSWPFSLRSRASVSPALFESVNSGHPIRTHCIGCHKLSGFLVSRCFKCLFMQNTKPYSHYTPYKPPYFDISQAARFI